MRTLEEAIKFSEEVAEELDKKACDLYENEDYENAKACIWGAEEHRQRAEWLKELKAYRKIRRILSQNRIATDRYGEVVLWDDIKKVFKEVEADETDN